MKWNVALLSFALYMVKMEFALLSAPRVQPVWRQVGRPVSGVSAQPGRCVKAPSSPSAPAVVGCSNNAVSECNVPATGSAARKVGLKSLKFQRPATFGTARKASLKSLHFRVSATSRTSRKGHCFAFIRTLDYIRAFSKKCSQPMTALTIHATKPFPVGLLATLKQVKAEIHAVPISPDEDFSYLHSLTAEEEEAFKQATKTNQRRFWNRNSHLL